MGKAEYKIGIIGCGKRGRLHIPGLKAEKRAEVVGVADLKEDAAREWISEYGSDLPVYTDYRQMLEEERPDIVVACLWTPLHLPVFRDVVSAGVKLFHSEKPIAPTWEECLEMKRLAEKSACGLTFCHQRRFCSGNLKVRELVKEGLLGKILRMDLFSPLNLLDCGTHTFDQAMSFMDESPAKWVLCAVDTRNPRECFGVYGESMSGGLILFENGVRANFQVNGPDNDMGTGVRIYGEKGFFTVHWDGQVAETRIYDDPGWRFPIDGKDEQDRVMSAVVQDLVDILEHGKESELDYRKAMRAAEIIFACYESARSRRRVDLPLTGVEDNPFESMLAELARQTSAPVF